jgi:hypothetical protein
MARVLLFLNPVKTNHGAPFQIVDRTFEFTRIPTVGEYVSLGSDESGIAADYEVVLVHHLPLKPNDIDAEVYMKRVSMPGEINGRRPEDPTDDMPWKTGSWPTIKRGK